MRTAYSPGARAALRSERSPFVNGRQFLAFSVVGGLGFLVDSSVLYLGLALGLGLRSGRVLSYLAAVTFTWALNRRYTFGASRYRPVEEWARFAATQLAGAAVNLGTYFALIAHSALVVRFPVLGVAAGSLAGLAVNFAVARLFVFRGRPGP
ncbi:MAG: GtrA family protein [Steroidobacteraceae bacterium]